MLDFERMLGANRHQLPGPDTSGLKYIMIDTAHR